MLMKEALLKIGLNKDDIKDFIDLIEINDSSTGLGKKYELLESISGEKVKNRFYNLIIACWSAKDGFKKDIEKNLSKTDAEKFEKDLFNFDSTHIIQYLADAEKHYGIDPNRLSKNNYKNRELKLDKIVLTLINNSVPTLYKPFYQSESIDTVPLFQISDVLLVDNGIKYYNFDTIILSMKIIDKENKIIGDLMKEVDEYISKLIETSNKYLIK